MTSKPTLATHFHILDATWQDVKVDSETDLQRTIEPLPTYESDDDDEVQTRRKRTTGGKAKGGHFSNLHLQLYLFGTTATGSPLRATVTGFHPFFFVRLPLVKGPQTKAAQEDQDHAFQQALSEAIQQEAPGLKGAVECSFVETPKQRFADDGTLQAAQRDCRLPCGVPQRGRGGGGRG
jgi:hypothetical protein